VADRTRGPGGVFGVQGSVGSPSRALVGLCAYGDGNRDSPCELSRHSCPPIRADGVVHCFRRSALRRTVMADGVISKGPAFMRT